MDKKDFIFVVPSLGEKNDHMIEPFIRVGILLESEICFRFHGEYRAAGSDVLFTRLHKAGIHADKITLDDDGTEFSELIFKPVNYSDSHFELSNVTIGLDFHWERKENQLFKGELELIVEEGKLRAINRISLEDYLESVISSEMKATSSLELLKTHAVISRSWLISQIENARKARETGRSYNPVVESAVEFIRWYDREDHRNFDVCADDHCQRYQGITRQSTELVSRAVAETKGVFLMFDGKVCDARFSKCCGGVTETFENVWEPEIHPYLQAIADNPVSEGGSVRDLSVGDGAENWIRSSPDAFCNTTDRTVLSQVLNDYDQETNDFYRWKVSRSQEELSNLIRRKTGRDFGQIVDLLPVERGKSGRLIRLKIIGTKQTLILGKELEIRKSLSESHLYSSAFVVDKKDVVNGIPGLFELTGAGWGHGVGLCQIGAAMMAEKGYSYSEILGHYFKGAKLSKEY